MQNKVSIQVESENFDEEREKNQLKLLCLDLTFFSSSVQFFICCIAVFIFYLIYGYLQELIFTLEGFKPFGWYLTLVQFFFYTIFGLIETKLRNISTRRYL